MMIPVMQRTLEVFLTAEEFDEINKALWLERTKLLTRGKLIDGHPLRRAHAKLFRAAEQCGLVEELMEETNVH